MNASPELAKQLARRRAHVEGNRWSLGRSFVPTELHERLRLVEEERDEARRLVEQLRANAGKENVHLSMECAHLRIKNQVLQAERDQEKAMAQDLHRQHVKHRAAERNLKDRLETAQSKLVICTAQMNSLRCELELRKAQYHELELKVSAKQDDMKKALIKKMELEVNLQKSQKRLKKEMMADRARDEFAVPMMPTHGVFMLDSDDDDQELIQSAEDYQGYDDYDALDYVGTIMSAESFQEVINHRSRSASFSSTASGTSEEEEEVEADFEEHIAVLQEVLEKIQRSQGAGSSSAPPEEPKEVVPVEEGAQEEAALVLPLPPKEDPSSGLQAEERQPDAPAPSDQEAETLAPNQEQQPLSPKTLSGFQIMSPYGMTLGKYSMM